MNEDARWEEIADWWIGEVASDPTYRDEIVPWATEMLGEVSGRLIDLGCGEGQVLRASVADWKLGVDLSEALLNEGRDSGAMVRGRLPGLAWLRRDAVDAAVCVLVLEHLPAMTGFVAEVARIVRPGGVFALVMNHPAYTADGAGPVIDLNDGEVLWRWGNYLDSGSGTEPAGPGSVIFHHRPLAAVLSAAGSCGLALERLEERGISSAAVARDPGLAGQQQMPRLLAARWRVMEGRVA